MPYQKKILKEKPKAEEELRIKVEELELKIKKYQTANSKLARQLQIMKHFFDHSLTSLAILDRNFKFVCVNHKYAVSDERKVEDFVGKNIFKMYPSEAQKIFEQVVETKQPFQIFARPFVYPENPERGTSYWDWTLVPVLDDRNEVELLLLSLNDVTRRKKAEIELERFFELSPDLFCVINMEDLKFLRLNKAFTTTLEYTKHELLNKSFLDMIHPQDLALAQKSLADLEEGQAVDLLRIRFRCKNGTYKYLQWKCSQVTENNHFFAVGRDVTDVVRMEEKMLRLERMRLLGEMAAFAGHEIKNPLTSIHALMQLLTMQTADCTFKKRLELMLQELERINDLITRFLSLAKEKPINRKRHNLVSILQDLSPLIQATALDLDMTTNFELNPIPDLMLDREEIVQLILNLTYNGLQAMSADGVLTIRTCTKKENVVLIIQDQGVGISPEILDKIGTLFFTTKEYGTGMGLAVCNHIASRHDAVLKIEPQSVGTKVLVEFACNLPVY